ncbi:MAG: YqgE/AlgH family protein [Gemmatimonadota bacterium]
MSTLKRQLLVSTAALQDPNFRHTVVLVGEHNADGALGVVLNRPLNVTVGEAVPALASLVGGEAMLFQGGPVQPESPVLLAEFDAEGAADLPVFGSVGFLVGDVSAVEKTNIRQARIYAGYAGWGPGQLEAELEEGAWILDPARVDDVFTEDPELLWSRVLRRKGPDFENMARVPFDPRMN